MNPISQYLKKDFQRSKIDYDFQSICLILEKEFGKKVWALPHKLGNSDVLLKDAWSAYEKVKDSKKKNYAYFMGIVRCLKPKQ